VAEVRGPAEGLAAIDDLDLAGWHLYHAVRADLLERLGRTAEAAAAYATAIDLAGSDAERRHLAGRLEALGVGGGERKRANRH